MIVFVFDVGVVVVFDLVHPAIGLGQQALGIEAVLRTECGPDAEREQAFTANRAASLDERSMSATCGPSGAGKLAWSCRAPCLL